MSDPTSAIAKERGVDVIHELLAAMSAVKMQLSNVQQMNSKMQDEESDVERTLSSLLKSREDELEVCRQSKAAQQHKLDGAENENRTLKAEIAALRQTAHERDTQNDELKATLQRKEAEMSAFEQQTAVMQHTLQEQQQRLAQFMTFHEEMSRKLSETEADKRKLADDAQVEQKALEFEVLALKKCCEEQNEVRMEKDSLRTEMGELRAIIQGQEGREAQLCAALEQMTQELRESQSERDILVKATKKELEEVSLLKLQCDELEHILHSNSKRRRKLKVSLDARDWDANTEQHVRYAGTTRVDATEHTHVERQCSMKQQMKALSKEMVSQQHKLARRQDHERHEQSDEQFVKAKDDL